MVADFRQRLNSDIEIDEAKHQLESLHQQHRQLEEACQRQEQQLTDTQEAHRAEIHRQQRHLEALIGDSGRARQQAEEQVLQARRELTRKHNEYEDFVQREASAIAYLRNNGKSCGVQTDASATTEFSIQTTPGGDSEQSVLTAIEEGKRRLQELEVKHQQCSRETEAKLARQQQQFEAKLQRNSELIETQRSQLERMERRYERDDDTTAAQLQLQLEKLYDKRKLPSKSENKLVKILKSWSTEGADKPAIARDDAAVVALANASVHEPEMASVKPRQQQQLKTHAEAACEDAGMKPAGERARGMHNSEHGGIQGDARMLEMLRMQGIVGKTQAAVASPHLDHCTGNSPAGRGSSSPSPRDPGSGGGSPLASPRRDASINTRAAAVTARLTASIQDRSAELRRQAAAQVAARRAAANQGAPPPAAAKPELTVAPPRRRARLSSLFARGTSVSPAESRDDVTAAPPGEGTQRRGESRGTARLRRALENVRATLSCRELARRHAAADADTQTGHWGAPPSPALVRRASSSRRRRFTQPPPGKARSEEMLLSVAAASGSVRGERSVPSGERSRNAAAFVAEMRRRDAGIVARRGEAASPRQRAPSDDSLFASGGALSSPATHFDAVADLIRFEDAAARAEDEDAAAVAERWTKAESCPDLLDWRELDGPRPDFFRIYYSQSDSDGASLDSFDGSTPHDGAALVLNAAGVAGGSADSLEEAARDGGALCDAASTSGRDTGLVSSGEWAEAAAGSLPAAMAGASPESGRHTAGSEDSVLLTRSTRRRRGSLRESVAARGRHPSRTDDDGDTATNGIVRVTSEASVDWTDARDDAAAQEERLQGCGVEEKQEEEKEEREDADLTELILKLREHATDGGATLQPHVDDGEGGRSYDEDSLLSEDSMEACAKNEARRREEDYTEKDPLRREEDCTEKDPWRREEDYTGKDPLRREEDLHQERILESTRMNAWKKKPGEGKETTCIEKLTQG
ncbi:PREDICTED: uncharacterized protein LOC106813451 [Priapulus caudatus]|uniref:Uncharacterized protein LOC106813451 n=1 Tax=Priapulus caudatus TaxID=37621 RepID=A0ABM1ELJ7_PRICU|nr:PREDICTED: uncharacterized protein LOC106813451 [Priapulus caudatus]